MSLDPGEGHGNPLQYSYLENPHGQRTRAGYSLWGLKESDVPERSRLPEPDLEECQVLLQSDWGPSQQANLLCTRGALEVGAGNGGPEMRQV